MGINVDILTCKLPDFTREMDEDYIKTLQETKPATQNFIQECLLQTVTDWEG